MMWKVENECNLSWDDIGKEDAGIDITTAVAV